MNLDEYLIRNTIRIETETQNGTGSGTGFFYEFQIDNSHIPVIVTNKHVIKDSNIGHLYFSICNSNGEIIANDKHRIDITDFEKAWIKHPDDNIDLCIMPIAQLVEELLSKNINPAYSILTKENIPLSDNIKELSTIEDVTVVGYPDGIWDSVNNLPIVRKGITATPLKYNFEGNPKFLVDSAIFPGSSGSPVFIYNQGAYHIGNTLYAGNRLLFVGIIYAVTLHTVTGNIEIIDIPTMNTPLAITQMPNNLGVAIKAEKLFDFEDILKNMLSKQNKNVNES